MTVMFGFRRRPSPAFAIMFPFALLLASPASATVLHVDPLGHDTSAGTAAAPLRTPTKASSLAKPGDTVLIHGGAYEMNEQIAITCTGTELAPIVFTAAAGSRPLFNFGISNEQGARGAGDMPPWMRMAARRSFQRPYPQGMGPLRRLPWGGRQGNRSVLEQLSQIAAANAAVTVPHRLPPVWIVAAPQGGNPGVVVLHKSSFVILEGITVTNAPGVGILGRESDHCTVRACSTYNTFSSGISAWDCRNHVIEKNRIVLACNKGAQECISISRTHYYRVVGNEISHTTRESNVSGGEGIDCKEGSSHGVVADNYLHHLERQGLYIDSWRDSLVDVDVYGNTVHDCLSGFSISTEVNPGSVTNVRFHHNLIYNCRMSGVWITTWGSWDGMRRDISIHNNTIVRNGWPRSAQGWPHGGIYIETEKVENLDIRNNILSENCAFQIAGLRKAGEKVTSGYNLIDGPNSEPFRRTADTTFPVGEADVHPVNSTTNVVGKALFVDAAAADFRLQKGSAAIDAGDPAERFRDPDGSRCDIGTKPLGAAK